jgi:uncharacterized protein (DUF952 family)
MIFHITQRARWDEAQRLRVYRGDTLDTEGFIHCSEADQVLRSANKFYTGQHGLVLLGIDPSRLHSELRYEPASDGQQYPHIYGPLNPDAVVQTLGFEPAADGRFALPPEMEREIQS